MSADTLAWALLWFTSLWLAYERGANAGVDRMEEDLKARLDALEGRSPPPPGGR